MVDDFLLQNQLAEIKLSHLEQFCFVYLPVLKMFVISVILVVQISGLRSLLPGVHVSIFSIWFKTEHKYEHEVI